MRCSPADTDDKLANASALPHLMSGSTLYYTWCAVRMHPSTHEPETPMNPKPRLPRELACWLAVRLPHLELRGTSPVAGLMHSLFESAGALKIIRNLVSPVLGL